MPSLIILRLHPVEPVDGPTFKNFLQGLTITAFDLTFGDSLTGVKIGTASGLADAFLTLPNKHVVDITKTSILQHYLKDIPDKPPSLKTHKELEAAATAVIVVNAPPGHPEYPSADSFDVRLEITRGGNTILDRVLHYNVTVANVGTLSTVQTDYFDSGPFSASAILALPSSNVGLDPNLAYVDLPPNGLPPQFDALVKAIDLVLKGDPAGANFELKNRLPLTPAESHHVAAEIVWNRVLYPLPAPHPSLGELYTEPPVNENPRSHDERFRDRMLFEAETTGYQAIHDAEVGRLAGFVSSASAAIACETMSKEANKAGLDFPLIVGPVTGPEIADGSVILTQAGPLNPSFVVPAAYFYALGAAMPPQVSARQRFDMARLQREERLLVDIQASIDAAVIAVPAAPLTPITPALPPINLNQAARRLHALGSIDGSAPEVTLAPPVTTIVSDWLTHAGPTEAIEPGFWISEVGAQPAAYLELLLEVITGNHTILIAAVKTAPLNVATVADLVAITDQKWRGFFLGPPPLTGLLPPFTQPGTPSERAEAFIRHLREFFAVPIAPSLPTALSLAGPPSLDLSISDIFETFAAAYLAHAGTAFSFGGVVNPAAKQQAIADVFPSDLEAQDWLTQALDTVDALFRMTDLGFTELHFSLMEALFARGFTNAPDVQGLSLDEFRDALSGTVAYAHASQIYSKAGAIAAPAGPKSKGFRPINPDGSLTDCIPPPHLSPLGPVEYLAELLRLSATSTCEEPFGERVQGGLGQLLSGRRGPLGSLHATRSNLETPLPMIDLVNESLEALTGGLPGATGGAVYDTAADVLAGHHLRGPGENAAGPFLHDPQTLFAALPEHSTPATPVKKPGAYDKLRVDFTAPVLPYAQPLDINRSYLSALGSTRFRTMRTFREDITELVIDPANEPTGFQKHLWRYPVRFPIALEYLEISSDEYQLLYSHDILTAPSPGKLLLRELFGFSSDVIDGVQWTQIIIEVPQFLRRTGLSYCEFLDLWHSGFVGFVRAGADPIFPECLPCCPDDLKIAFPPPLDPLVALRKLAVFVRLWRRLQQLKEPTISFAQLRDISDVFVLFNGDLINPNFLRELAALLMLRDFMHLPLYDKDAPAPVGTGADRTHLLAVWVGPAAAKWDWAIALLLDHIEDYAELKYPDLDRAPELIKILAENLDALSRLVGFDPDTASDTWHFRATNTLRFVEVLAKIYISGFTVGQILFLFTPENHLPGDDPFKLSDPNEALEDPLDLPEDDEDYQLWSLRRKLRDLTVDDEAAEEWTWQGIAFALREELGFTVQPGDPDPLDAFGAHFFPSVLERSGQSVAAGARQYRVSLAPADTAPLMWNTPPGGPLQYDKGAELLSMQIPVGDDQVIQSLQEMRPLTNIEQAKVQELYFSPRAELAQLSFIFGNFGEAVDRMIHEPDEKKRWSYFRREFARFYRRCRQIARHLADHVAAESGLENTEDDRISWKILRHLYADENFGKTPWEDDAGAAPDVTWGPRPHGGAFAALLGVTGTGLLTEFQVNAKTIWREVSGSLSAFGKLRNELNTPVPVILPSMNLALTLDQQRFVVVRNGLALRDVNGEPLGGAQPFTVKWSGVLLVEESGQYRFHAGAPTPEGEEPAFDDVREHRWRLTLRRGQKEWILLNHHWPGEDAHHSRSAAIPLRRGAYKIVLEFAQEEPTFATVEDICRRHCGFEIKYTGPDSDERLVTIPLDRLFRDLKSERLSAGLGLTGAAGVYLDRYYTSTLRDVRRTYQRAFKALLFAHRFGLSSKAIPGDRQSELGYMLDHGAAFLGTSYPRTGASTFNIHRAHFDFNLLPVTDSYRPPDAALDERNQPTKKRQAALFDWWERIWDYVLMRKETRPARERPAWLLFYEASEHQPDDPPQLVRHLGVDIRHAPLVLNYFATPAGHTITTPELEDERWAIRVWKGEKWVRNLQKHFYPELIAASRPDLWASDDPAALSGAVSGNGNLTQFVRNGSFENGEPRRYEDVTLLNNKLRERARVALLAYLCGMDRVALPWGGHAATPRDLSDLLLQDVEVGTCQRASRIEEAISALQKFVQRARLGLEPAFPITPVFVLLWDRSFSTFRIWEICKRRWVYRENWISWDEMEKARETEAFRFLQNELRRATLTVPVPGGLEYWPGQRPPVHPGLTLLQSREPAGIKLLTPGPDPEGLDLMGTPERNARPSWLAPLFGMLGSPSDDGGDDGRDGDPRDTPNPDGPLVLTTMPLPVPLERVPLWIQAAIRLGTRFIRVAAGGVPPASTSFEKRHDLPEKTCCVDCGKVHASVIDEYYFWLQDSRYYSSDGKVQDADQGVTKPGEAGLALSARDMTSDWHQPDKLPQLLAWESDPMVHLFWCRFHNGEFKQPRRSDEGVRVDPKLLAAGALPQLDFMGRTADSLRFTVLTGIRPTGYVDPAPPGFRYDLATDSAVVLPLVVAPSAMPPGSFPGGLDVYPYFAYFAPGAPLVPRSMFAEATAVAGTLRAHCRFEAALKWYELVFNPLHEDSTWAQCPPTDPAVEPPPGTEPPTPSGEIPRVRVPSDGRTNDLPCCPSTPVTDDVARDRPITLEYLETLLQWGEALMCRNTPEAFQQATVIFDTLARVLGAHPLTIFAQDDEDAVTLSIFQPRPAALNPRLVSLYDRNADRLALIHHCLNGRRLRNGRTNIDMPYFGNSTLRDGWQTIENACQDENDWCLSCCSAYRFTFLVQKALELAGEVRGFGAALLAAYEKGDAEYLTSLRATHERQMLHLALEVRQNQWREADWQVQALQKTKEGAQTRQRYYQTLLANGLNAGEIGYQASTGVSMGSRTAGNVSETIAQGMGLVPDFQFGVAGIAGTPLQFNQLPLGTKLAGVFSTAARIMNVVAEIAGTQAALSSTVGGWDRREDEWRHQVEVIGIEIEQIERQILAAERRRDIALRELNNHQRQMEDATEVQNFLRDKFTSHELYLFLQQETAALHRRSYGLALQTARQAQRAFNFERGVTAQTFLPEDAWDNLHEALVAGDKLQVAVHQMEKSYLNANCREYELTKHISLRLHFPQAFLHLRMTGYCEIDIPEWMFDHDYPGHYMRRIKSVSVTIPCVVGPYTGVHCRLTLLSSRTRVDPRLIHSLTCCCNDPACADAYRPLPDDPRIMKAYAATEAIATSSGQNDSGLFELNFRDERYLPFEFAGAVSRWRIELPHENNQWSPDTLTDFVMHVNYTAREGGDELRRVANNDAQRNLPGAGVRLFDVRNEFPDSWRVFQEPTAGRRAGGHLPLRLSRGMFPFMSGRREVRVNRLELFFESPEANPSASREVEFLIGHHRHSHHSECDCERRLITCVASSEWPELYQGVLEINSRPLSEDRQREFGTLRFSSGSEDVERVFVLCRYQVV